MLGITNRGVINSIDDLTEGKTLPEGAVVFRESNKLGQIFYDGFVISLPLFIALCAFIIWRYEYVEDDLNLKAFTWISLGITAILLYLSTYLHEFIHAVFYPLSASKIICRLPEDGAHLLYCDAEVSKARFIFICLAPVLFLCFIPIAIWALLANIIPMPVNFCFVVFALVSFFSAIGDFTNVFNCLRQVPNGANVLNFGIHSYWIKKH